MSYNYSRPLTGVLSNALNSYLRKYRGSQVAPNTSTYNMRRSNMLYRMRKGKFKKLCRKIDLCNSEKKYFLIMNGGGISFSVPSGTAGIIASLSDVAQSITTGQGDSSRIGDQINIRSLEFSFRAQATATAGMTNLCYLRLIIFQYLKDDVTAPTISDILNLQSGYDAIQYMAPYNHDKRYWFRILYDNRFKLVSNAMTNYYTPVSEVSKKIFIRKFAKNRIQYIANGVTGQYKIYYIMMSSATGGGSTQPTADYISKLNYSD